MLLLSDFHRGDVSRLGRKVRNAVYTTRWMSQGGFGPAVSDCWTLNVLSFAPHKYALR